MSIRYRCKDLSELSDLMLSTAMRAPDNFAPGTGLDFETAFAIIRTGFDTCRPEIGDAQKEEQARALVEKAHEAYLQGQKVKGSHLLQEAAYLLHMPQAE